MIGRLSSNGTPRRPLPLRYLFLIAIASACSSSGGDGSGSSALECGNGKLDTGEECDGNLAPSCDQATMGARPVGNVVCNACHVDASGCAPMYTPPPGSGGGPIGGGSGGMGGTSGIGTTTGGFTGGITVTGGSSGTGSSSGGASNGGSSTSGSGGTLQSGGTTGSGGTTSSSSGGSGTDPVLGDVNALRQACVDTINMYRATLNLTPLTRASATIETCSDMGADQDATAGVAHGSAGKCPGMGAQDTCPGWPPGQYGGAEGALKQCLSQMWAEGLPSEGRDQCLQEYFAGNTACFEAHGHYLNMSDPGNTVVSCGFYVMPNGDVWMNQDFGN